MDSLPGGVKKAPEYQWGLVINKNYKTGIPGAGIVVYDPRRTSKIHAKNRFFPPGQYNVMIARGTIESWFIERTRPLRKISGLYAKPLDFNQDPISIPSLVTSMMEEILWTPVMTLIHTHEHGGLPLTSDDASLARCVKPYKVAPQILLASERWEKMYQNYISKKLPGARTLQKVEMILQDYSQQFFSPPQYFDPDTRTYEKIPIEDPYANRQPFLIG